MQPFERMKELSSTGLNRKIQGFRALFCEGLIVYAAQSKVKNSIVSVRAQLALIAGEQIERKDIHPVLLEKAEDLTK